MKAIEIISLGCFLLSLSDNEKADERIEISIREMLEEEMPVTGTVKGLILCG